MSKTKISLIRVKKNEEHIRTLYKILEKRSINISHRSLPSYADHKRFVLAHPYRFWYLISENNNFIGNTYILRSNSVGITLLNEIERVTPVIITEIMKRHKPLSEIKSVRTATFDFNASPNNVDYISALKKMGAKLTQVTFSFEV